MNLGLALLPLVERLNGELGDVADGLAVGSNLFPFVANSVINRHDT